jgi:protein-tyrosine kinase
MSRIHEALRRAELERENGRVATNASATQADRSVEPAVSSATAHADPAAPQSEKHEGSAGGPAVDLYFEELITARHEHVQWKPDLDTDVFSASHIAHQAEQFRILRSRLYHLRNERPLRTLLVTSSMAGEGKTFVAGNLVRSFARQHERRVLVIDADLRRPRMHLVFGAPDAPGLSDYLKGAKDASSIVQQDTNGNLCLIPSGSHVNNPSELLSNGRMKTLLERMTPAFDWIVIDSPPCLPVADAGVIAQWCDGLLLVVRAEYTPAALISKSQKELKGRNVVGVVLNAVGKDHSTYGQYYGGYGQPAVNASK